MGSIFPSTSRKVFIFLDDSGVKSGVPWGRFYQLCSSISSKDMCSLHGSDFYLYIYHFYWELTSRVSMQEIALRLR